MIGWRGKLGLIIPANNTVIEPEFSLMIPDGVTVHSTRIISSEMGVGSRKERLTQMVEQAMEIVNRLEPVDVIGYACLHSSFFKGVSWDEKIGNRFKDTSGKPATTAASAILRACSKVGINNISIASPYNDEANEDLRAFMEGNGFKVDNIASLKPVPSLSELVKLPSSVAYRLAKKAFKPRLDGVLICATDFSTIEILDSLEWDIGRPVVSTNQALLWDLLRLAKIREPIKGFGTLLRNP
ncbi:MAG: hypothetical protein GTN80_05580 [Nitrososphaeria archaeon]|nr:hypothetical protein [Nitrososphaeria archaeon]NIN52619.1 hypothetical protein [Nitrososphaeria archaeon]NIQ33094.1 hypothetical protein [Nitrososphaeria archaeon]